MSVCKKAPRFLAMLLLLVCAASLATCSQVSQRADREDDVEVTEEQRKALSSIAAELGWSDATITRLRRITGFVMCEDRQKVRPIGSGAIVGTDLTLLTAAHLFFDEAGRVKHSLRCHFQNQSIPVEKVPLNFQKIDDAIFGTATPRDDQRHNDWMVVGLAYALPSVEPLRVDPGAFLAEGREVIGISAFQRGVHWVSRVEPVAQVCKHWRLRFMDGAPPMMTTNCQGAPGASGSTVITESGGHLVAAGVRVKVFEGRGILGYSPVMGDAVAINSSIIAALEKLSGKKVLEGSLSHAPLFILRRGNR
jgi:Trypsin-like peptidase domain